MAEYSGLGSEGWQSTVGWALRDGRQLKVSKNTKKQIKAKDIQQEFAFQNDIIFSTNFIISKLC
jgi:hypothetical protein